MKKNSVRIAMAGLAAASLLGVAATNETYTVDVNHGWMRFTNCIAVSQCPGDGKNPSHCTLIRYVGQYGIGTNDFHAWMVPVIVTTNRVRK